MITPARMQRAIVKNIGHSVYGNSSIGLSEASCDE